MSGRKKQTFPGLTDTENIASRARGERPGGHYGGAASPQLFSRRQSLLVSPSADAEGAPRSAEEKESRCSPSGSQTIAAARPRLAKGQRTGIFCRPRGGKRRAVRRPAVVTRPRKRGFLALVRVDRPRPSLCWWPEPPGRPSRAGGPGGRRLEGYGLSGLTGALAGPPSREWGFVWPAAVHGRARCPPLQPDSRCRKSGPGPRRAWQPDWPGSARSPLPSSPAGRRQPRVPVLGSRVVVRAPSERMQAAGPKA
ncbi:uncharacterized protein LOC115802841 [Delphinapterus leucas]|uniref:Uncharacterized protein LOC115802841 n=1 Tax=Delphinapterus leucas TaxID=9749 RepID=A0A7F8K881_DELLE|nr:uncharacterized protein LOC115802841 [Delphinapterus leucas]